MYNFSEAHTTDAVFAQAGPQAGCYLPFPRLVFLLSHSVWQVASRLCLLTSGAVFCKDDINGDLSLKLIIPHAVTLSSAQDPLMYNEKCMYIVQYLTLLRTLLYSVFIQVPYLPHPRPCFHPQQFVM